MTTKTTQTKYTLYEVLVFCLVFTCLLITSILVNTQNDLINIKGQLITKSKEYQTNITNLENKCNKYENEIDNITNEMVNIGNEINILKDENTNLSNEVDDLKETIKLYENKESFMEGIGYGFNEVTPSTNELFLMEESLNLCHNPTFDEMIDFLDEDITDTFLWELDIYMCLDFSWDVMCNAREQKIRCGYVVIHPLVEEFDNEIWSHVIIVFNTTDEGLVFVDPQGDKIYKQPYFEQMQEDDYYPYTDMKFDHYTVDWFYWYYFLELVQTWDLYISEYPDYQDSYDEYFEY